MSAPVSQMSAAALPTGTKQFAFVAALCQGPDDASASRLGMTTVLLEHKGEVLSDELRTRDPALASGVGEQPIILWVKGDSGRLLSRECHGSNMTRRLRLVKRSIPADLPEESRQVEAETV